MRRQDILSKTGLSQIQPGDANKDSVVDISDLSILSNNYNKSGDWSKGDFNNDGQVDCSDLNILTANFQKINTVSTRLATVTPGGKKWPASYPSLNCPRVQMTWNIDPDSTNLLLDQLKSLPQYPRILFYDNETSFSTEQELINLLDKLIIWSQIVKNKGWSPGVVSLGPCIPGKVLSKTISIEKFNTIITERLVSSIDWFAWEFYGPLKFSNIANWILTTKSLNWDVCLAPFLHPYSFGNSNTKWATLIEWQNALSISKTYADLTILWQDIIDKWPIPITGDQWLYHILALRTFGISINQPWLADIKFSITI